MIPKPGKRDLTKPRAWRPISLLSCLSKGLERLIAKRMAWTSVQHEVLDLKQAGALPKRSAVDLAAALIHDIDQALMEGKVAMLVTMDVQGAFDAVLLRWVESFMTGRSPISPILFLLYTQPIYLLGNRSGRFGYADDTAILRIGNTIEETVSLANADVAELSQWGTENAVSFDPDKTEVYDGEIRGALEGLRAAAQIQNGEKITVCIDSTAALTSLMGTPSDSSQAEALAFQELAIELRASLRWCPGHMGIPGNEMVDEQAKLGASLPNNNNTITLAAARRIARRKPLTAFQQWWKKEALASYQRLQLQVTLREPPELSLTRNNLHRLIAARSGHGDFTDYYTYKYLGSTATRTCSCGRNKTLDHIFYCRKVNPKHRIKLGLMPSVTIAQYLGPDFERFIKLVNETGFFQKICP
ncbi:hypothetical protein PT974_10954 [Cladobotryum mycophilum]|uniref:RNase H type-1 domain-containing protein n=1 Tax=Cladobotryum mycophilum TaxID=491253 RepID=A0ABR0SCC9_9HYPO